MENFIQPGWDTAITLGFSKGIFGICDKIVSASEAKVQFYAEQWVADVIPSYKSILIPTGEAYDWHFDNLDYSNFILKMPRANRFWTDIIYLTNGSPLEIGNWNPDGGLHKQTEFCAPVPSKTLARIWPRPGLSIRFPCFMVHRVLKSVNRRWALVRFSDDIGNQKVYQQLWQQYFCKN